MKTKYRTLDGKNIEVEYDENAPCIVCGEPVIEASMGGTAICPWCDCGKCRYCGVDLPLGEDKIKSHIEWHKDNPRGR